MTKEEVINEYNREKMKKAREAFFKKHGYKKMKLIGKIGGHAGKGKKLSEEHKRKISESMIKRQLVDKSE